MLDVRDVSFAQDNRLLFRRLNLQLNPGDMLYLQGENGAGKTTFLNIIAGITEPTAGQIYWDQRPVLDDMLDYQGQLAFLTHQLGLKATLTVREQIEFYGSMTPEIERLIPHSLFTSFCGDLSAGQRQIVGFASLIAKRSILWLLDEPFTALDADKSSLILASIQRHLSAGGMCIVTSHQPDVFADVSVINFEINAICV